MSLAIFNMSSSSHARVAVQNLNRKHIEGRTTKDH